MLPKKASLPKQLFISAVVAVLLTIGCTNSEQKKTEDKPMADTATTQKMDTASIRPSKVPN